MPRTFPFKVQIRCLSLCHFLGIPSPDRAEVDADWFCDPPVAPSIRAAVSAKFRRYGIPCSRVTR